VRKIPRLGTAHNALDDALHQARCVQLAVAKKFTIDGIPVVVDVPPIG